MRSRNLLTAVGPVRFERPYYCCDSCHHGQSPRDRELDVVGTDYSPGVRRMMAVVGSDASFDHGREQMELLAGLAVTRKAVERHAEAIGSDIAHREEVEIQRAVQLDLPEVTGSDIPILYIEMDGTGVPVTAVETEGRTGKNTDEPAHTREVKLGCVFTQTTADEEGRRCAMRTPQPTPEPLKPPASSGAGCITKPGSGAGPARTRRSLLRMVPSGSGTSPTESSPAPSKSWIFTTPANTYGCSPESSSAPMSFPAKEALGRRS